MSYPNVLEEIEEIKSSYLPLTGGELNGTLSINNWLTIKNDGGIRGDNKIAISGSMTGLGGWVSIFGENHNTHAGVISLDTTNTYLKCYPNGGIYTKATFFQIDANQAIPLILKNNALDVSTTPSVNSYCGLDCRDKNDTRLLWFGVRKDTTGYQRAELQLQTSSDFVVNNQHVLRVANKATSGETTYRRYSDGWIEQFGVASVPKLNANTTSMTRVTLPLAFTSYQYKVFTQFLVDPGNSWDCRTYATPRGNTTFDIYFCSTRTLSTANGLVSWYACGY